MRPCSVAATPLLTSLVVHRVGLEQPSKPTQPLTNLTALQMPYRICSLTALHRPYSTASIPILAEAPLGRVHRPRGPCRSLPQRCSSHGCCPHDRRACGCRPHLRHLLAAAQAQRRSATRSWRSWWPSIWHGTVRTLPTWQSPFCQPCPSRMPRPTALRFAIERSSSFSATPSLAWARYQNLDDERPLNITSGLVSACGDLSTHAARGAHLIKTPIGP